MQLGSGRSPDQGHAEAMDRRVVTPVNGLRLRKSTASLSTEFSSDICSRICGQSERWTSVINLAPIDAARSAGEPASRARVRAAIMVNGDNAFVIVYVYFARIAQAADAQIPKPQASQRSHFFDHM
jgi:hypothetical protein